MKKKFIIVIIVIFLFFIALGIGGVFYYTNGLKPVSMAKQTVKDVLFEVSPGTSSKTIVENLAKEGLIRSKYVGFIYLKLNKDVAPKAGKYYLNKGMSFEEIIKKISDKSDVDEDSINVTFIEGKRITDYVKVINTNFGYSEEEIIATLADKEYLQELIDKYWFLTDEILNDKLYYALEGYLYPDTYAFKKDASIKDIIEKMLEGMNKKVVGYKDIATQSKYTFHQILTIASIVELEGANSDDRLGVSGVFYNRLENGMSLGSDVTTYYGARINMADRDLYQWEIEQVNDYNTRPAQMAGKLPVGPICSPSIQSIVAAIEPEEHDYFYFVADKNGKTYFSYTYSEHQQVINRLKQDGLWYVYN